MTASISSRTSGIVGRRRAERSVATRGSSDSGSPIHQSSPSGAAISSAKNCPSVRAGDPADDLAGEPAVRAHVVPGRGARLPPRRLARRAARTTGSQASASSRVKSPSTTGRPARVRQHVAHRAASPCRWPRTRASTSRDRRVRVEQPALDQEVGARSRSRPWWSRTRPRACRRATARLGARSASPPRVDHRRAVHVDAARRADLAVRRSSSRTRRPRAPEAGFYESVDVDHRAECTESVAGRIRVWPHASTSRRSGCPKNAVDSDKVVASLLADGLVPAATARRRRSRRGQHLRVHRGGPPGVDRRHARARRRQQAGRPARRHRLHGRALRRRARRRAARGRRGRRFAGEGSLADGRSLPRPQARPACATCSSCPRPAPTRAVGVREGRRGLRPRLRVLRDPVVPRASSAPARPSRSRPRSRALVDGGVAEIVLVAQDLAWYGRDVGEPGSLAPLLRRLDRARGRRPRARPAALPLPERGAATRSSRRCSSCRRSCPYFDLSLQHADAGAAARA